MTSQAQDQGDFTNKSVITGNRNYTTDTKYYILHSTQYKLNSKYNTPHYTIYNISNVINNTHYKLYIAYTTQYMLLGTN